MPRPTTTLLPLACLLVPALAGAQENPMPPPASFTLRTYSGGYAAFIPGAPAAYGLGGLIEPRLFLTDQIQLAVRLDFAALGSVGSGGVQALDVGLGGVAAAMIKVECSPFPGEVRPFAGLGAGWYALMVLFGSLGGTSQMLGSAPGVMPQLGLDLGWFRVAVQYHLLLGALGPASFLAVEVSTRVY
ncbi:MAG TPA: hypothetical protein VND93_08295 [Myxococcales bacterium]|jgi:hypothetical protein|nr:hypothetical protein [Myxococcales bacterium]